MLESQPENKSHSDVRGHRLSPERLALNTLIQRSASPVPSALLPAEEVTAWFNCMCSPFIDADGHAQTTGRASLILTSSSMILFGISHTTVQLWHFDTIERLEFRAASCPVSAEKQDIILEVPGFDTVKSLQLWPVQADGNESLNAVTIPSKEEGAASDAQGMNLLECLQESKARRQFELKRRIPCVHPKQPLSPKLHIAARNTAVCCFDSQDKPDIWLATDQGALTRLDGKSGSEVASFKHPIGVPEAMCGMPNAVACVGTPPDAMAQSHEWKAAKKMNSQIQGALPRLVSVVELSGELIIQVLINIGQVRSMVYLNGGLFICSDDQCAFVDITGEDTPLIFSSSLSCCQDRLNQMSISSGNVDENQDASFLNSQDQPSMLNMPVLAAVNSNGALLWNGDTCTYWSVNREQQSPNLNRTDTSSTSRSPICQYEHKATISYVECDSLSGTRIICAYHYKSSVLAISASGTVMLLDQSSLKWQSIGSLPISIEQTDPEAACAVSFMFASDDVICVSMRHDHGQSVWTAGIRPEGISQWSEFRAGNNPVLTGVAINQWTAQGFSSQGPFILLVSIQQNLEDLIAGQGHGHTDAKPSQISSSSSESTSVCVELWNCAEKVCSDDEWNRITVALQRQNLETRFKNSDTIDPQLPSAKIEEKKLFGNKPLEKLHVETSANSQEVSLQTVAIQSMITEDSEAAVGFIHLNFRHTMGIEGSAVCLAPDGESLIDIPVQVTACGHAATQSSQCMSAVFPRRPSNLAGQNCHLFAGTNANQAVWTTDCENDFLVMKQSSATPDCHSSSFELVHIDDFVSSSAQLGKFQCAAAGKGKTTFVFETCVVELGPWGGNSDANGNSTLKGCPKQILQLPNRMEIHSVSCGGSHCAMLTSSGFVWAWGDNSNGQLGLGKDSPPSLRPMQIRSLEQETIISVSCGSLHTVASSRHTVYTWGTGKFGQLGTSAAFGKTLWIPQETRVSSNSKPLVFGVAAGGETSAVILLDGTLLMAGCNDHMQCGVQQSDVVKDFSLVKSINSPVREVVCGLKWSACACDDGQLIVWGKVLNPQGPPLPLYPPRTFNLPSSLSELGIRPYGLVPTSSSLLFCTAIPNEESIGCDKFDRPRLQMQQLIADACSNQRRHMEDLMALRIRIYRLHSVLRSAPILRKENPVSPVEVLVNESVIKVSKSLMDSGAEFLATLLSLLSKPIVFEKIAKSCISAAISFGFVAEEYLILFPQMILGLNKLRESAAMDKQELKILMSGQNKHSPKSVEVSQLRQIVAFMQKKQLSLSPQGPHTIEVVSHSVCANISFMRSLISSIHAILGKFSAEQCASQGFDMEDLNSMLEHTKKSLQGIEELAGWSMAVCQIPALMVIFLKPKSTRPAMKRGLAKVSLLEIADISTSAPQFDAAAFGNQWTDSQHVALRGPTLKQNMRPTSLYLVLLSNMLVLTEKDEIIERFDFTSVWALPGKLSYSEDENDPRTGNPETTDTWFLVAPEKYVVIQFPSQTEARDTIAALADCCAAVQMAECATSRADACNTPQAVSGNRVNHHDNPVKLIAGKGWPVLSGCGVLRSEIMENRISYAENWSPAFLPTRFVNYRYRSGDLYQGTMTCGVRSGWGKFESVQGGVVVSSSWRSDAPEGNGELCIGEKCVFQGRFTQGAFDGWGFTSSIASSQIVSYMGPFANGHPHGRNGRATFDDSSSYVGEWKEGRPSGLGTLVHSDGDEYFGHVVDGLPHGQHGMHIIHGGLEDRNGFSYCGEWKHGQQHGAGVILLGESMVCTEFTNGHAGGPALVLPLSEDGPWMLAKLKELDAGDVVFEEGRLVVQRNVGSAAWWRLCSHAATDSKMYSFSIRPPTQVDSGISTSIDSPQLIRQATGLLSRLLSSETGLWRQLSDVCFSRLQDMNVMCARLKLREKGKSLSIECFLTLIKGFLTFCIELASVSNPILEELAWLEAGEESALDAVLCTHWEIIHSIFENSSLGKVADQNISKFSSCGRPIRLAFLQNRKADCLGCGGSAECDDRSTLTWCASCGSALLPVSRMDLSEAGTFENLQEASRHFDGLCMGTLSERGSCAGRAIDSICNKLPAPGEDGKSGEQPMFVEADDLIPICVALLLASGGQKIASAVEAISELLSPSQRKTQLGCNLVNLQAAVMVIASMKLNLLD